MARTTQNIKLMGVDNMAGDGIGKATFRQGCEQRQAVSPVNSY